MWRRRSVPRGAEDYTMKSIPTRRQLLQSLAAAPALAASPLARAAQVPAGFRPLFDGKTMAGWRAISRVPRTRLPRCAGAGQEQ